MLNKHEELLHRNLKVIVISKVTATYNSTILQSLLLVFDCTVLQKRCIRCSVAVLEKTVSAQSYLSLLIHLYTAQTAGEAEFPFSQKCTTTQCPSQMRGKSIYRHYNSGKSTAPPLQSRRQTAEHQYQHLMENTEFLTAVLKKTNQRKTPNAQWKK